MPSLNKYEKKPKTNIFHIRIGNNMDVNLFFIKENRSKGSSIFENSITIICNKIFFCFFDAAKPKALRLKRLNIFLFFFRFDLLSSLLVFLY